MSRRSRRLRRAMAAMNPLPKTLSKGQKYALYGVGGAAVVGTAAYFYYRARKANCWAPAATPFRLAPGHYRVEFAIPAADAATLAQQWAMLVVALPQLLAALPGLTVNGMWLGANSYPGGTAVPSNWPTGSTPNTGVVRLEFTTGYSSTNAAQSMPAGTQVWVCSSGPVPAPQSLPANIGQTIAQILASAGMTGSAGATGPTAGATGPKQPLVPIKLPSYGVPAPSSGYVPTPANGMFP